MMFLRFQTDVVYITFTRHCPLKKNVLIKYLVKNPVQFEFIRPEIDQALLGGGGGWSFAEKREQVLITDSAALDWV